MSTVRARYRKLAPLLVDTTEIAHAAGVSPQAVTNWRRRWDDFPAPLDSVSDRPIYAMDEVDTFLKARGYTPNWLERTP